MESWGTYLTSYEDKQASILFDEEYSKSANSDGLDTLVRVKFFFKDSTEHGFPTQEEFPTLIEVGENIENAWTKLGAVYVGRLTMDGFRSLFFYSKNTDTAAEKTICEWSASRGYELDVLHQPDPKKEVYWEVLYPKAADQRMMKDMMVLEKLAEHGDQQYIEREVLHFAIFGNIDSANSFANWLKKNYQSIVVEAMEGETDLLVRFAHMGTMDLGDITSHTINLDEKATELKGNYDGWETSIEKGENQATGLWSRLRRLLGR